MSNGLDFPHFAGDTETFSAVVSLDRKTNFANFVQRRSRDFRLLESLLIVRHLYNSGPASVSELAKVVQRPREYTMALAQDLEQRLILTRHTDALYAISEQVLDETSSIQST